VTAEASGDEAVDLTSSLRVHIVGVGGPGMNPIAGVLAAQGHIVSGSDIEDSPDLERLRGLGVSVTVGHDATLVAGVDVVVRSTAIPADNVEVVAARAAGIRVSRRAGVLRGISALRRTIAVAGTHGKTTTSSMLALAMRGADASPSFIIGGHVKEVGSGSVWDPDGEWFVVEADESDGTFFHLDHEIAVVTNIERDHLEYHGSFENLLNGFRRFMDDTTGPVIVCADDEWAALLGTEVGAFTYGVDAAADFRIVDISYGKRSASFVITYEDSRSVPIELPVPGLYNVANATAAFAAAYLAGCEPDPVAATIANFAGVSRRFEFRGEAGGVTFVDDYAHLGTEVSAAIAAARTGGWKRVVAVFQPHRYSRTEVVWRDFSDSFQEADLAVITDVYPAGEQPRPGVTGKLLVRAILDAHPWSRVGYLPDRAQLRRYLAQTLKPGDLCLTMGAGDLTSLPDQLMAELNEASQ